MDGWMGGWMGGWVDGWMDEWMGGRIWSKVWSSDGKMNSQAKLHMNKTVQSLPSREPSA